MHEKRQDTTHNTCTFRIDTITEEITQKHFDAQERKKHVSMNLILSKSNLIIRSNYFSHQMHKLYPSAHS